MSGRRRRAAPPLSGEFSSSAQPGVAAKKRGKRELRVEFSAAVREPALKEQVAAAWACRKALNHGAVTLDPVPFHHCVIPNFIQSEDFLEGLQKELLSLDFQEKSNDLYRFKQSSDLKKRKEPHIVALRLYNLSYDSAHTYLGTLKLWDLFLNQPVEALLFFEGFDIFLNHIFLLAVKRERDVGGNMPGKVLRETLVKVLFEEFRVWLSSVTQVDLEPTIDLSCAKYDYTDALLCHDDELEGRRIAFILYLVPPWDKADGGTLDFFSTDDHFQPQLIIKSLVPSWNSLAFFEVSPVSFHQVAEVISKGKCRLSVSGWFHGSPVARTPRHIEPLLPRIPHIPCDHKILYDWINPVYLEMDSQAQIQEEFEDRSEILLKDFLKRDKFHLVCEALKNDGPRLSSRGPPNKRFYKKAEEESLPTILKECMELLGSEAFFLLLSNFTGLKLHFLAPTDGEEGMAAKGYSSKQMRRASSQNGTGSRGQMDKSGTIYENEDRQRGSNVPLCSGELRHWTKSCYTLIHDAQTLEFALDLLLFCGCEDWDMDYGGFTSYIAKGEDEELLTISPENNCLALVYRDQETLKFVKYINHRSLERTALHPERTGFWDFCFVYYECSEEEDHHS